MNRIKIIGLRNLPLEGIIDNQKDYKVSLIVSLNEIRTRPTQGEEEPDIVFVLKTLYVESVEDVAEHKEVRVQKGFSKSQAQRFKIMDYLRRTGREETEANYELVMDKVGQIIDKWGI
jgi:hypothetical protein